MCELIGMLVGQVALTALSVGVQYAGEEERAVQQEQHQEKLVRSTEDFRHQNTNNTINAYGEEVAAENLADQQRTEVATQDSLTILKETLRAAGIANASYQSQGQGTSSVILDLERQGADFHHNIERNLHAELAQSDQRKESHRIRAMNSINSVQPPL